jgi:hypothetical protein
LEHARGPEGFCQGDGISVPINVSGRFLISSQGTVSCFAASYVDRRNWRLCS